MSRASGEKQLNMVAGGDDRLKRVIQNDIKLKFSDVFKYLFMKWHEDSCFYFILYIIFLFTYLLHICSPAEFCY